MRLLAQVLLVLILAGAIVGGTIVFVQLSAHVLAHGFYPDSPTAVARRNTLTWQAFGVLALVAAGWVLVYLLKP